MATSIIDPQLHAAAFPATYIGPGTLIGNPSYNLETNTLTGYYTSNGNDVLINVGFAAQEVEVFNVTDNTSFVWKRGLAATNTIKTVAAGTRTIDATSAIVVATFGISRESSVTIAAAQVPTGKLVTYKVIG